MGSSSTKDARINDIYQSMSFIHKIYFKIIHFVDQHYPWHKLPLILGLFYLDIRRTLHQNYNLLKVGDNDTPSYHKSLAAPFRTSDGEDIDPSNSETGARGSFFGRNGKPFAQETDQILDPHPSVVATKLLTRKSFIDTGEQFNMLAASWIQFMIHDWADHLEATNQVEITAPSSVAAQCPLKAFKFYGTKGERTGSDDIQIGHRNMRTAWWDSSVIYGSQEKVLHKVRTFRDGKLRIDQDGLLQHNDEGIPISGDVRNSWAGVSLLQALFIKEHNAVCDMLKKKHPEFEDEDLYRRARLVVSAVIAKIHTIDWTVELLKMPTLNVAMHVNWYGLLGKRFKSWFGNTGSPALSGYIGMSEPIDHGVPYSITEEFVAVYRMHCLLPDDVVLRNIHGEAQPKKTPPIAESIPMNNLIGVQGEAALSKIGNERMIVSLGHQACGALVLFNYPTWMRDLAPSDPNGKERPDHVDMPALEIFRDRERNVARYNNFRRNMLMIPIQKWEDLTDDKEAIGVLREVYGEDVDRLDLLVGLMAEKKIEGYAISETAFFIFLLMASRRLEADRFFTKDFNAKVYTKEGLAWVNNTESLKDVLKRHHSQIADKWLNAPSAFSVWSASR